MKRFVLVWLGAVFLVLSGCGDISTHQAVMNAQATIIAASMTPTITATHIPNAMAMVEKINSILNNDTVVDDLSKAIDAHYQVMNIHFEPAGSTVIIFQLDVLCICVQSANCFVPERTFVVLAHAMKVLGKKSLTMSLAPFWICK